MSQDLYTYEVTHNPTGEKWGRDFTPSDAAWVAASISTPGPLPFAPANQLVGIWNRANINHRQEFTYRLVRVEGEQDVVS